MLPPIHFFPQRHRQVVNNYYGTGWNPFGFDMAMFNIMKPMMIGSMISNIGLSIANIISGKRGNCGCSNINNTMHNPYNMYSYSNMTANNMYPYVNFSNRTNDQGNTGSDYDLINKMENAYKKQGISAIYKMDDGRYCAVTQNGNITSMTLSGLSDEIDRYIKEEIEDKNNKKAHGNNEEKQQQQNNIAENESDNDAKATNNEKNSSEVSPTEPESEPESESKASLNKNSKNKKLNTANNTAASKTAKSDKNNNPAENKSTPAKHQDNKSIVEEAVNELTSGIEGVGTNPNKITNVLRNKNRFNKDTVVAILNGYNNKNKHHLWIAIDEERFYYKDSKIEDYQLIAKAMLERAKETVKNQADFEKVQLLYNSINKLSSSRNLGFVLQDTIYIKQFGEALEVLNKYEPKS